MKSKSPYWKLNKDATITVVIAAYLRHQPLNLALKSIYEQTYKKWKVLVIADCCDSTFKAKVDLSDERVRFINLPTRCGNQYGPNSVGIHLADTEYIAFLNHDDIWLPDHLETAINLLEENAADFFMGKAAFCHYRNQLSNSSEKGRLVFSELNKPDAIWRCLSGPNAFFEPISSWVIKNKLSKKIGYWRTPDSIGVTPVLNWIQRAAKKKAQFCFSEQPTTLKFNLHHIENSKVPIYNKTDPFVKLLKQFIGLEAETVRQFIHEDIEEAKVRKLITRKELWEPIVMTPEEKRLRRKFYDFIESVNTEDQKEDSSDVLASWSLSVITERTGEIFDSFVDPEIVIKELIELKIVTDE